MTTPSTPDLSQKKPWELTPEEYRAQLQTKFEANKSYGERLREVREHRQESRKRLRQESAYSSARVFMNALAALGVLIFVGNAFVGISQGAKVAFVVGNLLAIVPVLGVRMLIAAFFDLADAQIRTEKPE
jgi:Flp pilus assembly protein TadB